jgi:hypothetical protein
MTGTTWRRRSWISRNWLFITDLSRLLTSKRLLLIRLAFLVRTLLLVETFLLVKTFLLVGLYYSLPLEVL